MGLGEAGVGGSNLVASTIDTESGEKREGATRKRNQDIPRKPVVSSRCDQNGREGLFPDITKLEAEYKYEQNRNNIISTAPLTLFRIADEMREEHRHRVLGE